MSEDVGAALRRLVRDRANGCCEYCGMPDSEPVFPHEPDHIIAIKHGGQTTSDNLAYACFDCNRTKGSDIASIDSETGSLFPLFSPRTQVWSEHFSFNGPVIEARTPIGRVTVRLLRMNLPVRVAIRDSLMHTGYYVSPAEDPPGVT
ncbi:MAG: HNH endonuclease [Chloroflexota bacterium]